MSFDFNIPLSRDDLRRRSGLNEYVVDEVFSLRVLPAKLQELKICFRTKGALGILEHFDTVFSVLHNINQVDPLLREDAFEIIVKGVKSHSDQLGVLLQQSYLDEDIKLKNLNALKMNCYLLCQFVDLFESEATKPMVTAGKGKKVRSSAMGSPYWSWDQEREVAVRALNAQLQLSLHRLWDPPVVEEDFVNLVCNCCYKLLENPAVVRDKASKESIFHLLGVMVKNYNHALGCSLKMIQLLQHFEHLAMPLAQAVGLFAEEFGVKTIVPEVMREIGRIDPKDLARDTSGTRAFAAFLVGLAEKVPQLVLANISVIIVLLDGGSYQMRNSVLGVLAELIVRVLSKENLDSRQKSARDQFLDQMEDHLHDVHTFTRSKCLQVWLHVITEKALPLPRQHTLLELVIGRLQDKSSQVRKYAIQNLTALLRSNPFAAKLSVTELQLKYEEERSKLEEMQPTVPNLQGHGAREVEEQWCIHLPCIVKELRTLLGDSESEASQATEDDNSSESTLIDDDETKEGVRARLVSLLKEEEYKQAARLLQTAMDSWPSDHSLGATKLHGEDKSGENEKPQDKTEDDRDTETEEDETIEQRAEKMSDCMRNIYFAESLPEDIINSLVGSPSSGGQCSSIVNEYSKHQVLVQYLKDCLMFATQFEKAIPILCQLLGSKNSTDILETIDFFVTGFEFGLTNCMVGVRRMLVLVWNKESGIKEAVVESYRRLYLSPPSSNPRTRSLAVSDNLIALTVGATISDVKSLEEMVKEFMKTGELGKGIIQILWERFAMKVPNTTPTDSRAALTLLGMAAGADDGIVKSNVDVLVKEGLGPRAEDDFMLAKDTCTVLLKMAINGKIKGAMAAEPFRISRDHAIVQRITHLLTTGVTRLEQSSYVPLVEQGVTVIYKLAEYPDMICAHIIKEVAKTVVCYGQSSVETDSVEEGSSSSPGQLMCPHLILTRLLTLAGHIALQQLIHIDVAVFNELKRRRAVQELEHEAGKKSKFSSLATPSASTKKKPKSNKDSTSVDVEEEMGLAGALAEDAEAENIRKIAEKDIVTGSNLLSALRPLVVTVCNNQVKYQDQQLRAAASLALAKFMMVSSEFCETHLPLLFTLMEKSTHTVIRGNIIIALGDLTFRFPNLIEPWTPNLYARLRDESPKVRSNTLTVLSHLILNDMLKVKGQISELATCIVDHDSRIANLSQLFFHELAKKGNAIYNIMPDIISRLSDPDVGVEETEFQTIMKYLFSFIQKERQCDSLVEKLCQRFRTARVERQWCDLAFCLSLISYSEKSTRKLQENFACYGDKLHVQGVYANFMTIINTTKQYAKPEVKVLVAELQQHIDACHCKGVEDDQAAQKASKALAKQRKGKSPGKSQSRRGRGGRTPRQRRKTVESSDDESDESNVGIRRTSAKRKPKFVVSSDDDDDDDDFGDGMGDFQVDRGKNDLGERVEAGKKFVINDSETEDAENMDPNSHPTVLSPQLTIKRRPTCKTKTKPDEADNSTPVGRPTRKRRGMMA